MIKGLLIKKKGDNDYDKTGIRRKSSGTQKIQGNGRGGRRNPEVA